MGIFDIHADAPLQIEKEGQQITVRFERLENETGRITWNIPASIAGCASGQKPVYDGIVITVDSKPANYLSTSPVNGKYYNSDPTFSAELHVGDKIDSARVVGAFYHDTTTTSLIVTDVKPKTAYFVSAYAVDNVARYHTQGVHAYSLPTAQQETTTEDKAAYHDILLDRFPAVEIVEETGLQSGQNYTLRVRVNRKQYDISIDGEDGITYEDLVKEINYGFMTLENPYISPTPPSIGSYYLDVTNYKLYSWNGYNNIEQKLVVSPFNPSAPSTGDYWYNTATKDLYMWGGIAGWVQIDYINYPTDPTNLNCDTYWYDGTQIWKWDGNHWCKLCLYTQERNPLLGVDPSCGSYWFNTKTNEFYSWNHSLKKWDDRLVLVSSIDPNNLNTGDFWYDETEKKVKQFVGGTWNILSSTRYSEPNAEGELDNPAANSFWFIPSQQKLFRRNISNTQWIEQLIVSYPSDPRDRASCDLWWNTATSADDLFVWDAVDEAWTLVASFYKSDSDPTDPNNLPDCAVWYNPETDEFKKVIGTECAVIKPIRTDLNPADLPVGSVWFDGLSWNIWDGNQFNGISIATAPFNPADIDVNTFWYRVSNASLKRFDGSQWNIVEYSTTPLVPTVGTKWYNSVDEILLEWNGVQWVPTLPLIYVEMVVPEMYVTDVRSKLSFFTKDKGCKYGIEVVEEGSSLMASLRPSIIYTDPVRGASRLEAGSMINHLGVGTDGSPDERRDLHQIIRQALGYPTVQVELTKEQIDSAIDSALNRLRKYSGYATTRVWFFLDLKPNQQTYIMTDKCVGFNKIVSINSLHRVRSGAFRTSVFQTDIHAYAALQSLYSMGTFDLLSFHLVASYVEQLEEMFAANLMFSWKERSRELKITQIVKNHERILVDAIIERTEQELLTDRNTVTWIRSWGIAECKLMLAQIRGKFQTLPGPNGSTTLNSQELITQGESEKAQLMEDLMDPAMQNLPDHGMRSQFIIG
jgi:hypothetical protein